MNTSFTKKELQFICERAKVVAIRRSGKLSFSALRYIYNAYSIGMYIGEPKESKVRRWNRVWNDISLLDRVKKNLREEAFQIMEYVADGTFQESEKERATLLNKIADHLEAYIQYKTT